MNAEEEIALLRRAVTDLQERLTRLEVHPNSGPQSHGCICPASLHCGCASLMCPRRAPPNYLGTSSITYRSHL